MKNLSSLTKRNSLPAFAALVGNMLWGFSFLFSKSAMQYASPTVLLSHRFLIAFLCMNLVLLIRKERIRLKGRPLLGLAALCITEPLYFICESYGILLTNSVFAGVILSAVPVVSLLFAIIFLREYPSKKQAGFALLTVVGVVAITMDGNSLGIVKPIGFLLLLACCLISAAYKIANKKSSEEFTSFERTYFVLFVSALFFTVFAIASCKGDISSYLAPLREIRYSMPMLALCLFCSLAANLLVNYAAARMPVFVIATYGSVSTVCSLIGGALFLSEPLTLWMVAGTILIITGVNAITRK